MNDATREHFASRGIVLPSGLELDDAPHAFETNGKRYAYRSGKHSDGRTYLLVELVDGDPLFDSWCFPSCSVQSQPGKADPAVAREQQRYRVLAALGDTYTNASPEVRARLWNAASAKRSMLKVARRVVSGLDRLFVAPMLCPSCGAVIALRMPRWVH